MDYSDNWFLAGLSDEDLRRLKPHLAPTRYERGQVLCEAGRPIDTIWFFRVGMCSDIHALQDGFEVEVLAFGYESAFGLAAATGPSTSLTRDLCQVGGDGWRMPAPAFCEACDTSDSLSRLVLRHTQTAIGFIARSLACNTRHPLDARLSRWLLTASDYAADHNLDLTHEFLGIMLGATRSSITLGLRDFQREGLLKVTRGGIELLDRVGLMRRSCECYASTRAAWAQVRPGASTGFEGV